MPWSSTGKRAGHLAPQPPSSPLPPDRHRTGSPTGAGWAHEIKLDGYRLQIHVREGRVRLFTRTGDDWSNRFPWIAEDVALLGVRSAVFDAEGCCAAKDGFTDFDALHS
jgi:bifunctional non-homologous end joining protein LigD